MAQKDGSMILVGQHCEFEAKGVFQTPDNSERITSGFVQTKERLIQKKGK